MQWLLRSRAGQHRASFRFRLRYREGRSVVNAWTISTTADSITPDGQTLIFVQKTGTSKGNAYVPLTSLSIALVQRSNINATVFTLYQAHDTFNIGILKAVDGVGADAKCTVMFPLTEEPVIILAKFLVIVVAHK